MTVIFSGAEETGSSAAEEAGSSDSAVRTGEDEGVSFTPLTVFSVCRAASEEDVPPSVKLTTLSYVVHAATPTASRLRPSAR